MAKKLAWVLTLFLFSVLIIYILYVVYYHSYHKSNGFTRKFLPQTLSISKTMDLGYNSYYIAGKSSAFYLGNVTNPLHLLKINEELTFKKVIILDYPDLASLQHSLITVDSPHVYLLDWTNHRIAHGFVDQFKMQPSLQEYAYFSDGVAISPGSYVIKKLSRNGQRYELAMKKIQPPTEKLNDQILEYQGDSLFSIDGMLHYSRDLSRIYFLYYYRNQFLCFDSNLNLEYRERTIDTNKTAKISISKVRSEKALALSGPPFLVNKRSCIDGPRLYIESKLKADNENRDDFEHSAVVDIYDLSHHSYQGSFYIPKFEGLAFKSFRIFGSNILAIYDHFLVKYTFTPPVR